MRKGFRYTVKYVEHKDTAKGPITKFSIGDKIKDSTSYQNWKCAMFGGLDIKDGDKIVLEEITSIDSREYNGNIYHDCVVIAKKNQEEAQDDCPFDV